MRSSASRLLITGVYRSGTTLVEKLVHSHPDTSIASQPLPMLYVAAKERFLESARYSDPYPLGDRFLDDRYGTDEFVRFMHTFSFDEAALRSVAERQEGYSGAWTPEATGMLRSLAPGSLGISVERVLGRLAGVFGRPDARVIGSKEILVEEFIPYLLDRGWRVAVVVRDPRSVVASVSFGAGTGFMGAHRPTLFHIRNWRKTVAYGLAFEGRGVTLIRYEDVVRDGVGRLSAPLGLDPERMPNRSELLDQWGRPWGANSSFTGRPGSERWPEVLPESMVRYVEACTLPEMLALGYEPRQVFEFDRWAVANYREPFAIDRPEFPAGFGYRVEDVDVEAERVAVLGRDTGDHGSEIEHWFLFTETHRRLREAMRTRRSVIGDQQTQEM